MHVDQEGRRDLDAAESESDQLLQGPVHRVHQSGHHRAASSGHAEAQDSHRLQVPALDAQGLVQALQVVIAKGQQAKSDAFSTPSLSLSLYLASNYYCQLICVLLFLECSAARCLLND